MRQIILYLLTIAYLLISCNNNKSTTIQEKLIPQDTFIKILVDIHITDATLNTFEPFSNQSLYKPERHYQNILDKYHISKKDLDSTFYFYARDLEQFQKIYQKVLSQLSLMQGSITAEPNKKEAPKIDLTHNIIDYYTTFDSFPHIDTIKYKFTVSKIKNTTQVKANSSLASLLLDPENKKGPIVSFKIKKDYKKIKIKTSFSIFMENEINTPPLLVAGIEENKKDVIIKKINFNNKVTVLRKWQNIFVEDSIAIPAKMDGKQFKMYLLNTSKNKIYIDNFSIFATYE